MRLLTAFKEDSIELSHIAPRWQFSLRDLLLVTAVVALYLAAFVSVLRGLGSRDILELASLSLAALAGTILALTYVPRWVRRRAGRVVAVLRRETPRSYWIAWAVWLPLVIVLCHPLITKLLEWDAPSVRLRGLLILWMIQNACFAINSFVRRSLHLCERGMIRDGIFFVPWRKLHENHGWSIDQQGNLVASMSLWRVVASVPPEQRDVVEAVLRKKLGRDA